MDSIVVIQKNDSDEYPYLALCGTHDYVAEKIMNKLIRYPNGRIIVLCETPNAINNYNFLQEHRCIEINPERPRHFKLGRNYTHLLELRVHLKKV